MVSVMLSWPRLWCLGDSYVVLASVMFNVPSNFFLSWRQLCCLAFSYVWVKLYWSRLLLPLPYCVVLVLLQLSPHHCLHWLPVDQPYGIASCPHSTVASSLYCLGHILIVLTWFGWYDRSVSIKNVGSIWLVV